MAHLRIGSRGSQLARWQANHVAALLRERGHTTEIMVIRTSGDQLADVAFSQVGVKGMFTKEIEEALENGQIDLAVHSLKDLPTELAPQFELAAILEREDPRDAFLSVKYESLFAMPKNARVATSSLRRESQLRALRRDLEVVPVRGNVDTRLRKLHAGEFDAMVLAAAGLMRLQKNSEIRQMFSEQEMCPAAGQGALAVEVRSGAMPANTAIAALDSAATRKATTCERALLAALGGGCQVPIGAFARANYEGELHLIAKVANPSGSIVFAEEGRGGDARALGNEVAQRLLQRGASRILAEVAQRSTAAAEQP